MARRSGLNVPSLERSSRSELRSSDSYSDRDVKSTTSRHRRLKSSIDSNCSAPPPSVRLLGSGIDYAASSTCVAREITPSISLRRLLTQNCGTGTDDISTTTEETTSLPDSAYVDRKPIIPLSQPHKAASVAWHVASEQIQPKENRRSTAVSKISVTGPHYSSSALFTQLLRRSFGLVRVALTSTLRVFLCSITVHWFILIRIFQAWHPFVGEVPRVVILGGAIILLKAISILSWVVGFCPRKGWLTSQESELAGTRAKKAPGLEGMAPPARSSSPGDQ